jgi:hypothetical protein
MCDVFLSGRLGWFGSDFAFFFIAISIRILFPPPLGLAHSDEMSDGGPEIVHLAQTK